MNPKRRWIRDARPTAPRPTVRRRWLVLLVMLTALAPLGCGGSRVEIGNPIAVGRGEYDRVFEATLDVLRDNRFDIARQDRRFGVITTEPRTAAMALEVWHPDRTTSDQIAQNSINHQRYRITARIRPRENEPTSDETSESTGEADPVSESDVSAAYELALEARLERRQMPPRILNTAAVAGTQVRRKAGVVRPVRTERGTIEPHWRSVGRDEEYERRLIATILHRAAANDPLPGRPADPPTEDGDGEADGPYRPYQPQDSPDDPAEPRTPPAEDTPSDEDDAPGRYRPYPGARDAEDRLTDPGRLG